MSDSKNKRPYKGSSIIDFPDKYIVLDLETTGLSPEYDSIIEIGALKVQNSEITETYQQLINPGFAISEFIQNLTGITNEMLVSQPSISEVLPDVEGFVENNIIVGHNVNFDINFLYDNFEYCLDKPFANGFIDTMRMSRKVLPDLHHHRLIDIVQELGIEGSQFHRALSDCDYTYKCFETMKALIEVDFGGQDQFKKQFRNNHYEKLNLKVLKPSTEKIDKTNPLYNKVCAFTGTLEKYSRQQAAQIVVNLGGQCENTVTKKTNFLILGNNDYCSMIKNGKSTKQKKAEDYKLKGQDIEIIPESVFYDMIEE